MAEGKSAETWFEAGDRGFRSLIENATDIIVILDANGIFRYCSPSAERILGYRLSDVFGRPATEFVHPADVPLILTVLQSALQNPGVSQPTIEYRVQHRDGSWRIVEAVTTSLLTDPAVRGVVVNCHDITDRKQVEEALRAANHQIANLLEGITDAFISLDHEWRFTYLNQRAAQLLGRSPAAVLHQNFFELFPDLTSTTLYRECQATLTQQTPSVFEEFYPFLQSWFEVRISPSPDGLSIVWVDITNRRHAEAELLEMSTALGNAVEGIARLDTAGRYIALNRAYAEVLGYEQAEMIGMKWQRTVLAEDTSIVEAAYQRLLTEGKAEAEVRALRKDGSVFFKEAVMVAAYNWYDQFTGHHCFMRDITERKTAEAALRQQAERERRMAGLAQLSAGIAHRIRRSLNLEDILNTTVSEVRQFLSADRVIVCRYTTHNKRTVIAESVTSEYGSILGVRVQTSPNHQPIAVADLQQPFASPELQTYLTECQVKALLAVPILQGENLWGTLVAHQCSVPRQWQTYEVELLEQLAIQVAIAIQQSDLYQQVQQLNANLEQQVQERTTRLEQALHYESMLKRITDSVRDSLDEGQILQNVVQDLAIGLEVDGCDAAIYDLEQQTSIIQYEYIDSEEILAARGTVIRMADYSELYDQLLQLNYFQFCRISDLGLRPIKHQHTALANPIMDDQGAIGDLWLFKKCHEVFSDLEIRLVQQVANQCAIAVRQARLHQATQAQLTALEELNQLKDDFLSTVSHELRTPMSNMKMAIHMLKTTADPGRQSQYLEILQAECAREIELINDLLDLQRLEAASYALSPAGLDLQDCLTTLLEPFHSRTQERQQILTIELPSNLAPITTDRPTLERVLVELLNNACKYTPPKGAIGLSVQQSIHEPLEGFSRTAFTVRNQAQIPASELPRIFDKFYRVPHADRWKQGGTGLGLALVQRLVTELNGTIQVESSHGWTTFTVILPASPGNESVNSPTTPSKSQRES